jgi:hypothetical protein
MPTLVFGILVLALLLWALNAYSKVDPRILAGVFRVAGGILALAVSAFLFARGHLEVAIPLGLFGLGLLGWGPFASTGWFQRTQKTAGQVSRVRTSFVEMELDHDSGAMRGRILAGRHAGAALDTLDLSALLGLLAEVDADSRALLEAYLNRREPNWREHAQGDAAAGKRTARSGKMTEEEAYQILGVPAGASADDIGRAHRSLMKKLHPDQGGSTYLAAQINEAKEVLLRRHR